MYKISSAQLSKETKIKMQTLLIIMPVFAVILSGFLLKKFKVVKQSWVSDLNGFAYYVALPAIVFFSLSKIDWSNPQIFQAIIQNIFGLLIFGGLLALLLKYLKISKKLKAAILLTSTVGNTIYMGFPIGQAAFAPEYSGLIIGIGASQLVFGIAFGLLISEYYSRGKVTFKQYLKDFFYNPLILSLVLGIVFSFMPKKNLFSEIIQSSAGLLAATASPVALFALGAFMHGKFSRTNLLNSVLVSLLKLAIFPGFIWLLFKTLGFEPQIIAASFLLASMPTAATTFVLAEKFGLDAEFTATTMVVSTILSFFSIFVFLKIII